MIVSSLDRLIPAAAAITRPSGPSGSAIGSEPVCCFTQYVALERDEVCVGGADAALEWTIAEVEVEILKEDLPRDNRAEVREWRPCP